MSGESWDDVLEMLYSDNESATAKRKGWATFGASPVLLQHPGVSVGPIKVDFSKSTAARGALGIAGYALAKTAGYALLPALGAGVGVFVVASLLDEWLGW